jgi:hypothetical protein
MRVKRDHCPRVMYGEDRQCCHSHGERRRKAIK